MTLQAQDLQALQAASASMGLELPSMAYIVGAILFSTIGYVAWSYGRKRQLTRVKWLGVGLMLYSYAAFETWILYAVGVALCVALYVWRGE
jgi:hypothetical protein